MNRLFFCFAYLFVISACRNESWTANNAADSLESPVSILGIWKVQHYSVMQCIAWTITNY
jgi:hypothetical protein